MLKEVGEQRLQGVHDRLPLAAILLRPLDQRANSYGATHEWQILVIGIGKRDRQEVDVRRGQGEQFLFEFQGCQRTPPCRSLHHFAGMATLMICPGWVSVPK